MRKALLPILVLASLTLPAAAFAQSGSGNDQPSARSVAVKQCKHERAQIGRLAFKQKYGTPHAFKNCVIANGGSTSTGTDDQNGDKKTHHKHHKSDNGNGDQKSHHRHHKSDGSDSNGNGQQSAHHKQHRSDGSGQSSGDN